MNFNSDGCQFLEFTFVDNTGQEVEGLCDDSYIHRQCLLAYSSLIEDIMYSLWLFTSYCYLKCLQVFKDLFSDGLRIQKERITELRKYAKEQRDLRAKKQQQELESIEN